MSKTDAMPYIVGFVAGLIVTGLVLSNLDAELVGRLQRRMSDDMVRIGGGSFVMGCDPKSGWNCVAEEEPAQLVKVEAFELDRFEVTADEYQACVDAGVCFYRGSILDQRRTFKNSRGNHPINFVSWVEAHTFVYGVASAYRPMRSGRRRPVAPTVFVSRGAMSQCRRAISRLLIKMMSQIMELRAVAPDLVGRLEVDLRVQARMVSKT